MVEDINKSFNSIVGPDSSAWEGIESNPSAPSAYIDIKDDPDWDPETGYIKSSTLPPPLRAAEHKSLSEFYSLCYNILQGTRPNLRFVPAYPREYLSTIGVGANDDIGSSEYTGEDFTEESFTDTITYRLIRRQASGAGPGFSSKRKIIKPRVMQTNLPDPISPDHAYRVLAQEFDNIVQFDLFSRTNFEVEQLLEWFDDFLYEFVGFFKLKGIMEMIFWEASAERPIELRNDIPHRSLQWFIKTQKVIPIRERLWKRFDIEVTDILPNYKN